VESTISVSRNRTFAGTGRPGYTQLVIPGNATGRMVAGVLASLAELERELGKERRAAVRDARRARGQSIGRPKALDTAQTALAQRMHASGESAPTIAATLGVSRATIYGALSPDTAD
jgi:DNA invertase Pin-like site-specific DNA recombinase